MATHRNSRLHPLRPARAATYTRGRGLRAPRVGAVATLKYALDDAFYAAFGNVTRGPRTRIGLTSPARFRAASRRPPLTPASPTALALYGADRADYP